MLQIIGWLGCLYLVVKALEIAANPAYRDGNGMMKSAAMGAALLASFGAVGFALWLAAQGGNFLQKSASEQASDELSASIAAQCVEFAKTPEEVANCGKIK